MVTPSGQGTNLPLVIDFVNSLEVETGRDRLNAVWLAERSLLPPGERVGEARLARAREVREAVRALALANNGDPAGVEGAARVLDRQAGRSRLRIRFGPEARIEVGARGIDRALGLLLGEVAAAMGDGRWERVKACRAETCRWLFFDHAPNLSRRWCSMEVCGNREKARAYRARRRH